MIILDYKDRRPLYEQIVDKFSDMILKGVLKPDEKLPSVRNLAMELSINPNTIQRAYMELEHKGFLYSVKGRGNFVSDNAHLKEERKIEIKAQLSENLKEAISHGIALEEVISLVDKIYQTKRSGGIEQDIEIDKRIITDKANAAEREKEEEKESEGGIIYD